jgi:hypothetical protein
MGAGRVTRGMRRQVVRSRGLDRGMRMRTSSESDKELNLLRQRGESRCNRGNIVTGGNSERI